LATHDVHRRADRSPSRITCGPQLVPDPVPSSGVAIVATKLPRSTASGLWSIATGRGAAAFDVRTADVGVARADVFVDEIAVEAVLTQPMAAPHLVKHVRLC
jgi:hypothetical protein